MAQKELAFACFYLLLHYNTLKMCGIFGIVATKESNLSANDAHRAVKCLFHLSERRGREAAGLSIASPVNNTIRIFKQPLPPSQMLKLSNFDAFLKESLNGHVKEGISIIGHSRLVTNGTQVLAENNQPIVQKNVVGIHNGIIVNDRQLKERFSASNGISDSDSSLLFELIDQWTDPSLTEALKKIYHHIEGSASIAFFHKEFPALTLATNTGSLYYASAPSQGLFVFASEHDIVRHFLNRFPMFRNGAEKPIHQLLPFTALHIDFAKITPVAASLSAPPQTVFFQRKKIFDQIFETGPRIKDLRRCKRCVLPHTYPFIRFDEQGVCNYCRKYVKQEFLGREALESILEKYRSKDGSPDCIVGFSGGRDSSYGLHLLKKEFGMTPIAYTYDWALVTDQSRKNQAKVVGKLGVEHIIRAADIHKKRRYIRKNIYAWLKRPELGIVPLFMAGDKMFYYYGRKLRKETGVKLTIFSAGHQLEQMEFKVGFCGIDQHLQNNTKLYHFNWTNKARLALWYVKQYLLNPAYINESLWDSIFAFYSSFLNKDDYLYLYRYIRWDEKEIEKTLREEYGWEADATYGKNQWRMGDGQTAFINYIYYTVAGFSEYDNFRSNQIREGLLTRDEALKLIEQDNQPRLKMLEEFSQLIGFNLEDVLLKINTIPQKP